MDDVEQIYDELVEHCPELTQYFKMHHMRFNVQCSDTTAGVLQDLWIENTKDNVERLYGKHGLARDGTWGVGLNKASILIGAGPSFNQHKDLLVKLCHANAQHPFERQPFLFFCSNHQFKPCIEAGIIPHFVVLMDASEVVYDQLCKGVPRQAQGSILLSNFRAHPKVLGEWSRQGREILFFMLSSEMDKNELSDLPKDLFHLTAIPGGNVLNQMWVLATGYMSCNVFMAVGNDLSYDYDPDIEARRSSYYADGDYSTNIGTGRDEAKKAIPWMGYKLEESFLAPGHFNEKWEPKATTSQLLLYKFWLEARIGIQQAHGRLFKYFNCSQDGILGVLSKEDEMHKAFMRPDNWYLLDDIFPNHYFTKPLIYAVEEFFQWRDLCQKATRTDVGIAIN